MQGILLLDELLDLFDGEGKGAGDFEVLTTMGGGLDPDLDL
jgi:hypothetical protein